MAAGLLQYLCAQECFYLGLRDLLLGSQRSKHGKRLEYQNSFEFHGPEARLPLNSRRIRDLNHRAVHPKNNERDRPRRRKEISFEENQGKYVLYRVQPDPRVDSGRRKGCAHSVCVHVLADIRLL